MDVGPFSIEERRDPETECSRGNRALEQCMPLDLPRCGFARDSEQGQPFIWNGIQFGPQGLDE